MFPGLALQAVALAWLATCPRPTRAYGQFVIPMVARRRRDGAGVRADGQRGAQRRAPGGGRPGVRRDERDPRGRRRARRRRARLGVRRQRLLRVAAGLHRRADRPSWVGAAVLAVGALVALLVPGKQRAPKPPQAAPSRLRRPRRRARGPSRRWRRRRPAPGRASAPRRARRRRARRSSTRTFGNCSALPVAHVARSRRSPPARSGRRSAARGGRCRAWPSWPARPCASARPRRTSPSCRRAPARSRR